MASIAAFFDIDGVGTRALLIEGAAGIGKTTLWEHAVQLAQSDRPALVARPSQAEAQLSFSVLGDLFSPELIQSMDELPSNQRSALEAALLLGSTTSSPDVRAVSLAVLGGIRSLASAHPITIAIDDVQWIDALSARVLAYALRRLADDQVTIVAAQRLERGVMDPLDIAGLPVGAERLTLGPIAPIPLGQLLRSRLARHFSPPSVQAIYRASGGNPFFAIEIGRALQREGVTPRPGEPLPVPAELDTLLTERLATLSGASRHALLIAASLATPTSRAVLSAGGEVSGLREGEEAGIILVRGEAIEFTHPLLAASVYGGSSSETRKNVHDRLAEVSTDPEERARHLALSVSGQNEQAAAAAEDAAHQAELRGAPSAAADLFQLATSLTPSEDAERHARRMYGAVGNMWAAGDTGGARALNGRYLETIEPGSSRAYATYLMASMSWNDLPRTTGLLMRGLDESGDDLFTRASVLQDLAWASMWGADLATAVSWADAAIELGEALNESMPLRQGLAAQAMASQLLGRDAAEAIDRAVALEGTIDYNELSTPMLCLGQLQMWEGSLTSSRQTLEAELERRIAQGRETLTWEVRASLADVEYRAGHWALAAEHAREAHEILVEAGWSDVLGQVLPVRAMIACALGDAEQARVDGIEALSLCERMQDRWDEIQARSALGFLELSLGDHAACHAWLEPIVALTEGMGLREPGAFPFVPDEVEALVALGELDQAQRLTDRLEQQGMALDRPFALATVSRCRSLIASGRSDLNAAESHATEALSKHASLPQPFELGRTLLVSGVIQRRMRRQKPARELLHRAIDTFEELDAPLWTAKARVELGRVGGRAPAPETLTPTEETVARLVSEGSTNREVAESLFMSVHTVDAHLRRIYRKLGIRSRTELAKRF
jgi:DNA-binding CsgD family transcriptional regulator